MLWEHDETYLLKMFQETCFMKQVVPTKGKVYGNIDLNCIFQFVILSVTIYTCNISFHNIMILL